MKKLMTLCAIALSCVSTQISANYDSCCPAPCYSAPCCQEFKGFYLGGNVGVGSYTAHRNDHDGFLTDNSSWTTIDTSFVGGVQAGFDWQCGNAVYGLVADWNATGFGKRIYDNPNVDFARHSRADLDWFSTIRARAGLTVSNALVYVTAGAAVAKFETNWTDADDVLRGDNTRWGWAGGAGAEFFVWNNVTVGLDVLYLSFAHKEHELVGVGPTTYRFGHSDSSIISRLSVNYRFGDLCDWW